MAWLQGQPLPVRSSAGCRPGRFSTAAWTAPWPCPGQAQPQTQAGSAPQGDGARPPARKPSQKGKPRHILTSNSSVNGNRTV